MVEETNEQKKRLWDTACDVFIKVKKSVFNKKLLFWFYLLGLFIPPLVLAIPLPLYIGIYKLKLIENSKETVKEVALPQGVQSAGDSFFSKISGIKAYTLSTLVCVQNKNQILLNNEVKNPETLVDKAEAGAVEVVIKYPNGTNAKLYVPLNALGCVKLERDTSTSTPAYIANNPVLRHALPLGQPVVESSENGPIIKIPVYQTSEVDTSKTRIFAIPKFYSKEFALNVTIFFIAWSLVYIHFIKLYLFSRKTYSWTYFVKSERHQNRKDF